MSSTVWPEAEERGEVRETPHLSFSRLNKYLQCPEQYRLYYVENLRPRAPSASLVFGQVVHHALASLFEMHEDPVQTFRRTWDTVSQVELAYGLRESWKSLSEIGTVLLTKFVSEELPRFEEIEASEEGFELAIANLDLPFVGVIDLKATLDGKRTLVDFKTASSSYRPHEALLSDQLTAYSLAEPRAQQAALCVLVKTKEPKIEWHLTRRTAAQLSEFLAKAELIGSDIRASRFYKRPGMWCSWCDYLPVCTGDAKTANETLVSVVPVSH